MKLSSKHPWDVQARRGLILLVTVAAAVLSILLARVADAQPSSELQLLLLLNGEPNKVGTLESAGTSISNAATATPFTLTAGTVYMAQCVGAVYLTLSGGTASSTITASTYGYKLSSGDPFVWRAVSTAISMIPVSGSANCAVWRLK